MKAKCETVLTTGEVLAEVVRCMKATGFDFQAEQVQTAMRDAMRLRCAAKMALEDLEQATTFLSKKSRDRHGQTLQALRAALTPNV